MLKDSRFESATANSAYLGLDSDRRLFVAAEAV